MALNLSGSPFRLSAQEAGYPDYGQAFHQGILNYGKEAEAIDKPKSLAEALLSNQLKNKLGQVKLDYAPRMAEADLRYKNAMSQKAMQPAGGLSGGLSGPAKDAYALELLKNKLPGGEENPIFQNAKRLFEANVAGKETLGTYRQGLANTQQARVLTPMGKLSNELSQIEAGFEPGSNGQAPITPERQDALRNKYQLAINKLSSDVDTRKKALFAENMDKTVESIVPEDLVQYSGVGGGLKLKSEEAAAPFGEESEEYRRYQKSLSAAKLLGHQVRQFYGDSIQPAMTEAINNMVNPSSWKSNPELALQNYNAIKDILGKEKETYRGALRSEAPYVGDKKSRQSKAEAPSGSVGLYKNGVLHFVPADKAEDAVKNWGYKYE